MDEPLPSASQEQKGPLIILIGGDNNEDKSNRYQDGRSAISPFENDEGRKVDGQRKNTMSLHGRRMLIYLQWIALFFWFVGGADFSFLAFLYFFLVMLVLIASTDKTLISTDLLPLFFWIVVCGIRAVLSSEVGSLILLFLILLGISLLALKRLAYIDSSITSVLRLFSVDFKKMQQQHEEELKSKEDELMQKLDLQKEKLAYLESAHIAQPSIMPLCAVYAACLLTVCCLFYSQYLSIE